VELNALRQNLEKAEGDKTRVRSPAVFKRDTVSAALALQAAVRAQRVRGVFGF
jgi:hypothetical protein